MTVYSSAIWRTQHALCRAVIAAGLVGLAPAGVAAPLNSQGAYSEFKGKTCISTTFCNPVFTAIPAAKTLVVQNVSCTFTAASTSQILFLQLMGSGQPAFLTVNNTFGGSTKTHRVNNSVFAPFVAGQIPSIHLAVSPASNQAVNCTIAGELRP